MSGPHPPRKAPDGSASGLDTHGAAHWAKARGPLVEIHFNAYGEIFVRHWYHVPRAGDIIALYSDDGNGAARVVEVTWHEAYVEIAVE